MVTRQRKQSVFLLGIAGFAFIVLVSVNFLGFVEADTRTVSHEHGGIGSGDGDSAGGSP